MKKILMTMVLAILAFTATAKEVKWSKPFDYVITTPMDLTDAKCDNGRYYATMDYFVSEHQNAVDAKCKKYDGKFLVTRTYFKNGEKIESSMSSKTYIITDKLTTIIYIYDTYDEAETAYKVQLTANPIHSVEFRVK